jgi:hypothetical protein
VLHLTAPKGIELELPQLVFHGATVARFLYQVLRETGVGIVREVLWVQVEMVNVRQLEGKLLVVPILLQLIVNTARRQPNNRNSNFISTALC